MELTGLHHISGITGNIENNFAFYAGTLGLRLVKRTVNQDDVRAYHLFYADGRGSPGTDVTFFDWPHAVRERYGNHSISRTGLRVPSQDSLEWWAERLSKAGLSVLAPSQQGEHLTLEFSDPEGQRLALIADPGEPTNQPWTTHVPLEHAFRGLGPVTLTVPQLRPTAAVLTQVLGMRQVSEYAAPSGSAQAVHVFEMGPGGAGAEVHVLVNPDLAPVRPGAGGMHHVAFRVPNDEAHAQWVERVDSFGIPNSGLVDRYYFKALYFREPNGVLFELSTDGPGFATDEPAAHLGERLALPPFLEPRRADIEAHLKPLSLAGL